MRGALYILFSFLLSTVALHSQGRQGPQSQDMLSFSLEDDDTYKIETVAPQLEDAFYEGQRVRGDQLEKLNSLQIGEVDSSQFNSQNSFRAISLPLSPKGLMGTTDVSQQEAQVIHANDQVERSSNTKIDSEFEKDFKGNKKHSN